MPASIQTQAATENAVPTPSFGEELENDLIREIPDPWSHTWSDEHYFSLNGVYLAHAVDDLYGIGVETKVSFLNGRADPVYEYPIIKERFHSSMHNDQNFFLGPWWELHGGPGRMVEEGLGRLLQGRKPAFVTDFLSTHEAEAVTERLGHPLGTTVGKLWKKQRAFMEVLAAALPRATAKWAAKRRQR